MFCGKQKDVFVTVVGSVTKHLDAVCGTEARGRIRSVASSSKNNQDPVSQLHSIPYFTPDNSLSLYHKYLHRVPPKCCFRQTFSAKDKRWDPLYLQWPFLFDWEETKEFHRQGFRRALTALVNRERDKIVTCDKFLWIIKTHRILGEGYCLWSWRYLFEEMHASVYLTHWGTVLQFIRIWRFILGINDLMEKMSVGWRE